MRTLTEDIKTFFGFDDLDIDTSGDQTTLLISINKKEYRLDEIGSGIAHFIVVLVNVASRTPSIVLIDEPELNLHPRAQLEFLSMIGSYATHGVMFATHSIGLARASGASIYSVSQPKKGVSEVHALESTPSLAEFMGELGFSAYRDIGCDSVLLVEGRHDIMTFHQLLRIYGKDSRFLVLPLGGDTLICKDGVKSLAEIKRITENITVYIDSERDADGATVARNRQEFQDTCEAFKIRCVIMERRAIENYFTKKAVRSVKSDKYHALKPYEKLSSVNPHWSKAENWKIAREMTRNELDETDLGKFLDSL